MSSGLVKPKKYDWKDSNLALFGSSVEKGVKKDAAKTEPAWQQAGKEVGLKIWRIVNFKVTDWPKEQYGQFFNGDSYIVLHTYKPDPKSNELAYDIHFWIGANSTQDEYGTAAYKTVELDTFLDDKPVQHREVEGYESELFLTYFPKGVTVLEGGADSGFHHVKPEEYKPRLFHFSSKGRNVVVQQVPANRSRLNSGDVYVLDKGLAIWQWNGSGASVQEKTKAMEYVSNLEKQRAGKAVQNYVIDENTSGGSTEFYDALSEPDVSETDYKATSDTTNHLFRVSDAAGSMQFNKIKDGAVAKGDFKSADVFILDTPKSCFVWVGSGASDAEKRNGLGYAHSHLMNTADPLRHIAVVKEGRESKEFQLALAA